MDANVQRLIDRQEIADLCVRYTFALDTKDWALLESCFTGTPAFVHPGGRLEGFEAILAESTVPLLPVPSLDRKSPATSYEARGSDRLRVDLLVPARGSEVSVRPVPELRAHAQAMPHLRALLARPVDAIALGREGVVPVRVPRAEAFALHKALVSQLRGATSDKRGKDAAQAAVLLAVLAEDAPAAIEEAFAELPRLVRAKTRIGLAVVAGLLERAGHGRAVEVVKGFA